MPLSERSPDLSPAFLITLVEIPITSALSSGRSLPPILHTTARILFWKVQSDVSFIYKKYSVGSCLDQVQILSMPSRLVSMEPYLTPAHITVTSTPDHEPCSIETEVLVPFSTTRAFHSSLSSANTIPSAGGLHHPCSLAVIHIHVFQEDLTPTPVLPDSMARWFDSNTMPFLSTHHGRPYKSARYLSFLCSYI